MCVHCGRVSILISSYGVVLLSLVCRCKYGQLLQVHVGLLAACHGCKWAGLPCRPSSSLSRIPNPQPRPWQFKQCVHG